jgi:hypothetical protein
MAQKGKSIAKNGQGEWTKGNQSDDVARIIQQR